jgi:hypothetical protein
VRRWDWKVRTYSGNAFMLETVHRGDFSKDMEVEAALSCNLRAVVTNLHTGEVTTLTPRAEP